MKSLFYLLVLLLSITAFGQNAALPEADKALLSLQGIVKNEDNKPISGVNIEGREGRYATTDFNGQFTIQARLGDQIIIRGLGFETVYYRVRSNDDLEIRVVSEESDNKDVTITYEVAMDSAQYFFNTDSTKAANYLITALGSPISNLEKSRTYLELAKLYIKDAQYDLAVDQANRAVKLSNDKKSLAILAKSLRLNGNYQEAIQGYKNLLEKKNSAKDQVSFLTGLAICYELTKDFKTSISTLENALNIAKEEQDNSLITSLTTRLANVNQLAGETDQAKVLYDNAIQVAQNTTPQQILNAQVNKANFLNQNSNFSEEIELRKKNIQALESNAVEAAGRRDSITDKVDGNKKIPQTLEMADDLDLEELIIVGEEKPVTKQGEQFKIAEALKAQNKNDEAIEYYRNSLGEAMAKNDLATSKDAAIRLSDLYREAGNDNEAMKYGMIYINTADAYFRAEKAQMKKLARSNEQFAAQQNRISNLETVRSLNQKQLQLALTQQALDAETTQRQRWIIYSLGALSVLLVTLAYFMYRSNKQQKLNNRLLALKSLRSQMNPHFIFNALNSVNSFIALNDERAANRYLSDFSRLMRSVLENSELDLIPLHEEVNLLNLYLKLEHQRFEDKFDFEVIVEDDLKESNVKVPPMLVQPIIENAIWHGLRYKKEKGFLKLSISRTASSTIEITVTDNGIGRKRSSEIKTQHQKKHKSKGMGNIQNRVNLLNELKNTNIHLRVGDANFKPDVGTEVVLTIHTKPLS